ncbi:M23 family metallopeptidase [Pontibacter sp. MBLB2868]|uniref:M23 family metallopeptidase n=1 Tax=Pontibacter sp. MBLB2868 TaxID=3451555 RepID=UPI003F74E117
MKKNVLTALTILLCLAAQAQQIQVIVPTPARTVKSSTGSWVVFDTQISSREAFTPKSLEVSGEEGIKYSSSTFEPLRSDSTAFVSYNWVPTSSPETPTQLNLTFLYTVNGQEKELNRAVAVSGESPLEIGFPLRPGIWMAGNAPGPTSEHTKLTVKMKEPSFDSLQQGYVLGHNAQRYAIDFVKLDKQGNLFKNKGASNADWYSYGEEILAAAGGKVISVKDGIPEHQTPGKLDYKITIDNIAGNNVYIDMGKNVVALYAHMQPGSIKVKEGEIVKKGQVLGKLGNSGNSDAPHLHFHVVDTNNIPFAESRNGFYWEGIPYAFPKYTSWGTAPADIWDTDENGNQLVKPFHFQEKEKVKNTIPVNFEVIKIK